MSQLPRWVSSYVGIPFAESGASISGADCYGLVSMILEEQTGSPLPSTPEKAMAEGWYSVPSNEIRAGDVVLFALPRGRTHVALMVTDEHYIETKERTSSAVRRVEHFSGSVQVWRRG